MNQKELEKVGEYHDELMKKLRFFQSRTLESYVESGRIFGIIIDTKLWKSFAPTFRKYCTDYLHLSHTFVYSLARVDKLYGDAVRERISGGLGSSTTDISRVIKVLPYTTPLNAPEMLAKAEVLPPEAFENTIKELSKKGTPSDTCEHEVMENWNRCSKCQKFFRV
jgi:hypothetical protein